MQRNLFHDDPGVVGPVMMCDVCPPLFVVPCTCGYLFASLQCCAQQACSVVHTTATACRPPYPHTGSGR